METPDLVLISRRLVVDGDERPGAVVVTDGRVTAVEDTVDPSRLPDAHATTDVGDLALLPGFVDAHVHVNEPGRTAWEGFATATRAAAVAGVTTLIDMPLNSVPPTIDPDALALKREVAAPQVRVDVGFWGGVVPGSEHHLEALHDAGVFGVKAFTCASGVPEYGNFTTPELDALVALTAAAGTTLIVHAEDPATIDAATVRVLGTSPDPRAYATWLEARPPEAELVAIEALVDAARRHGARVHVLHLAAAAGADLVAAARADGVDVTVETCPHYLTLAADDAPDGATAWKCAPPIRDRTNQDRLWRALADGVVDAVVSDHSPAPADTKAIDAGSFVDAWGGIASLQLGPSLVWTEACRRGHRLTDLSRWMAAGPARVAGLARKGHLDVGADADLVVFDPDEAWTVDATRLHHRHPVCAHDGRELTGRAVTTYLRGQLVATRPAAGADPDVVGPPAGRLLTRGDA